jgi:hypothetical protein
MHINASIQLEGATAPGTADEMAEMILTALGGNTTDDYCRVAIIESAPLPGTAGTPPIPVPPPG